MSIILYFASNTPTEHEKNQFDILESTDKILLVPSINQTPGGNDNCVHAVGVLWFQVLYAIAHCSHWSKVTFIPSDESVQICKVTLSHSMCRTLMNTLPRILSEDMWWKEYNKRLP
jgi:hypothetical protein